MKNETPAVLPYSYYPISKAMGSDKPPSHTRLVIASKQIHTKSSTEKDVNDPACWDVGWFAHYE